MSDVAWPTDSWPSGELPVAVASRVDPLVEEIFGDRDRYGDTYAVLIVQGGRLVLERYAGELSHADGPSTPIDATTRLHSWSMAKSMLHAVVGILVGEGRLTLDEPAAVPLWHQDPGDPRAEITLQQLLEMRDGLQFIEDYVPDHGSDVIEMVFGSGAADVARFAADRPLAHPPGECFNYSSGTSNIVARIVGDVIGGGADGYEAFMRERLFDRIGMRTVRPRFDPAGTFIGSSFAPATAQDFARFGLLYLRDGLWDGARILPEGWVAHGSRLRSFDPDDGRGYGAHWWVVGDDLGAFWANGYQGQSIMCVPALDVVVVRLGKTPLRLAPNLVPWRTRLCDALR
jgi:CubicO group peptidase (beta-lactamase class C family)